MEYSKLRELLQSILPIISHFCLDIECLEPDIMSQYCIHMRIIRYNKSIKQ